MDNEKSNRLYSGDQALKEPDQDEFNRTDFAKRISEILTKKQDSDPLVIGLYGEWGEGKTSVINFIKYYLDKNEKILRLDFNPWRFNTEDELLNSFFKQFSQGIRKKLGIQGRKIAKELLTYSGLIIAMAEPITGLSIFASSDLFSKLHYYFKRAKSFFTGKKIDPLVDTVQNSLENATTLEKQKNNISKQLKKTGKKHIVFIDDIDRLDNEEIQVLFRIIKLIADFENVIYILSFDPQMVAAALNESYPGDENKSGLNFLEKIVQVPLQLPKIRRTDLLNDVLFPGIDRILEAHSINISDEEGRNIADALNGSLKQRLSTPRIVKRYLNGLTFSLPILKGEANIRDLILIEGLRICYPDAYEFVYKNKEIFISDSQKAIFPKPEDIEKEYEEKRESFLGIKENEVRNLLENLFPRIGKYSITNISEKELAKKQRISSTYYFNRYFSYSIPKQDLSDQDFHDFLLSFSGKEDDTLKKGKELIETSSDDVFIRKLDENRDQTVSSYNPNLAITLSKLGNLFTKHNLALSFSSPLRRASNLIRDILLNVPKEERYELSKNVIECCSSIVLSAEIGRHLHKQNNKEKILTDKEHQKLVELVSKEIKSDAENNGVFYKREETERDSVFLFNIWNVGASDGEVSEYIEKTIDSSPERAIQFIQSFMPTVHSSVDGLLEHGHFEIDQYNSVKKLISPKFIYELLKNEYKAPMKDLENTKVLRYKGNFYEGLAQKFAFYYENDSGIDKN